MRRTVIILLSLSMLMFACNISTTATPTVVVLPASITVPAPSTPAPVVTATSAATQAPAPQPNVLCNEISLVLDPTLASGFDCKTVAEANGGADAPPFAKNPKYTELTLKGYVLSGRFFEAHIDVYPVQRYQELLPDQIGPLLTQLQSLISGAAPGNSGLPFLPFFEAMQEVHVQYQVLPFGNGSGIRYLTQYTQFSDPINNHELFYTYQGLTSDGKDWISAILPISNPLLPENGDNPPNGQSWDQFSNNFTAYLADITNQLNLQNVGSFSPGITALDALAASIQIKP